MASVVASSGLTVVENDTQSVAFDVGTNPDLLVVVLSSDSSTALSFLAVTIDGQPLTGRISHTSLGRNIYLLDHVNPPDMSGTVTFQIVSSGFVNGEAVAYAVDFGGDCQFLDDYATGGVTGTPLAPLDPGGVVGLGFVGATGDTRTPNANTTEDYDANNLVGGHQTTEASTATNIGWTSGSNTWSVAAASYGLVAPDITPEPTGLEASLNAGSVAFSGPVGLPGLRVRALELGLNAGAITFTGPRQVALVGEGIETSEMTEGGTQGYLLTYNTASKPSWEAPDGHTHTKRWAPVTIDPDADGDFELLFTDAGDVVMMEVQD